MAKTSINFGKLSNGEVYSLVTGLLRDWQAAKVTLDDAVLTKLKTRLGEEVASFGEGLAELKDSQTAKDIETADRTRDQQLQILADSIKLGRYGLSTEEKEAYKLLNPLFANLRKIKSSNYDEESAAIHKLLSQLKRSEFQTAIRSLNLTKPIQNVTKSQESFDSLLTKRDTTKSSKITYDNKKTRKALQDTYTRLSDYLYVVADEATPVAYGKLHKIFQINNDRFKSLTTKKPAKVKDPATPADKLNQEAKA